MPVGRTNGRTFVVLLGAAATVLPVSIGATIDAVSFPEQRFA
jgi:hypothetical protein